MRYNMKDLTVQIEIEGITYDIPKMVEKVIRGLNEELKATVVNQAKTNACQDELAKLDNFIFEHFPEEFKSYMTSNPDEEKSPVLFTMDLLLNRKRIILPNSTKTIYPPFSIK